MADQLSALGFDAEHMETFFAKAWETKQVLDMESGLYIRLDAGSGAACYLSMSRETQSLLDWDAHLDTDNRLPCAFDADVQLDDEGQSGIIRVVLNPGEDEVPLTASVPVLGTWDERESGAPGLIQPVFCAESVAAAGDGATAYLACDKADNTASVCFSAQDCEKRMNRVTGRAYWHMTGLCCGQKVDMVCEESLLDAAPKRGAMLAAQCVVTAAVEPGVTEA